MKKTNKKQKYSYIVDCDKIKVMNDIDFVWAMSKQKAGLAITEDELSDIIVRLFELFRPKMEVFVHSCSCTKKTPWYKRVWNFLTKPFKK